MARAFAVRSKNDGSGLHNKRGAADVRLRSARKRVLEKQRTNESICILPGDGDSLHFDRFVSFKER
jgi:hypothetical protein